MMKLFYAAALVCISLCACDSKPKADPRADSIAAAQAAQARTDSLEAIQLINVDTSIAPSLKVDLSKMEKRPNGMYVLDRKRGSGAQADSGKYIQVHYTTWLTDGKVVDDTRKKGESRRVLLGYGEVVKAWEEGVRGMREGGRRILVAPPSLGYGKPGKPGSVPRLATLVFDIELLKVY